MILYTQFSPRQLFRCHLLVHIQTDFTAIEKQVLATYTNLSLSQTSPGFYASTVQVLKTLWEKEKLLITSNFSFSHNVFYPYFLLFSSNLKFSSAISFSLEESTICRLEKAYSPFCFLETSLDSSTCRDSVD